MTDFTSLIPEDRLKELVREWLREDIPSFDVGGMVVGSDEKEATLLMKSPGVVAGKPFVDAVFSHLGCSIVWNEIAVEGSFLDVGAGELPAKVALATVRGPVNKLLQGERTALNTMSRCSGVATASREAAKVAEACQWKGWVAGTRKVTPGNFRLVEKYGLLVGGVATHRLDLSQMVMLKDNHIWATGSITRAVALARRAAGFSQKIQVECQSLEEAKEACRAGADLVMLDNYKDTAQLHEEAGAIKGEFPHVLIEASGGITIETMANYLSEHVDIVSQGKLTQGYSCIDYSLKIVH